MEPITSQPTKKREFMPPKMSSPLRIVVSLALGIVALWSLLNALGIGLVIILLSTAIHTYFTVDPGFTIIFVFCYVGSFLAFAAGFVTLLYIARRISQQKPIRVFACIILVISIVVYLLCAKIFLPLLMSGYGVEPSTINMTPTSGSMAF